MTERRGRATVMVVEDVKIPLNDGRLREERLRVAKRQRRAAAGGPKRETRRFEDWSLPSSRAGSTRRIRKQRRASTIVAVSAHDTRLPLDALRRGCNEYSKTHRLRSLKVS